MTLAGDTVEGGPAPKGGRAAQAWYGLALLSLVSFFNYLDRMVVAVLIEPIKLDLDLSDTQMGLVGGLAFALFYSICGLPLARLADRANRVNLLSVCLAGWSLATAATGYAASFWQLFAARVAVGVGEAGCVPTSHSMIGDMFPPAKRTLAVGIFQAGGLLGLSAGMAVAGWLAEIWGWRQAIIVVGLSGIPLALLFWLTVREPVRGTVTIGESQREPWSDALAALLARPALRNVVLGLSIGAFATYGTGQWAAAFFMRSHGLTVAEAGVYGAIIAGGSAVLGTLCSGLVMMALHPRDIRWETWLPAICYALCTPLFVLMFLADTLVVALACQFVGTFLGAIGGTVAITSIQSFAEPHRRATAVALMVMLSSLIGLGLGPLAVGMISDALTPLHGADALGMALAIASAFLGVAAVLFAIASRSAQMSAAEPA